MRIRAQLILAFLVLSVVPLTGIVLYSYVSSKRTLGEAVEADAASMTREMNTRMAAVRDDLGRGLRRLGELPVDTLLGAAAAQDAGRNDQVARRILGAMGDAAPLVESVEFTPDPGLRAQAAPPRPPAPPSAASAAAAAALPAEPFAAAPAAPAPPAAPRVDSAGTAKPTVVIPLRKFLIRYRGGSATDPARQADIDRLVQQALRKADDAQAREWQRARKEMAKWLGKRRGERSAAPHGLAPGAENPISPQEMQDLEDLGVSLPSVAIGAAPGAPAGPQAERAPPAVPAEEADGDEAVDLTGEREPPHAGGDAAGGGSAGASRHSGAPPSATPRARRPEQRAARSAAAPKSRSGSAVEGLAVRGSSPSTAAGPAVPAPDLAAAMAKMSDQQREQFMMLGGRLVAPVRQDGRVVGQVTAQVSCPIVLRAVLARSRREVGEIPFALNTQGQLYAINRADEEQLRRMPLAALTRGGSTEQAHRMSAAGDDWVVVTSREPASGLILGIAHPIGRSLHEVAQTAGRNFGYGVGLIGLALIGILPLSRGMTRNLRLVTDGAQRIAQGDLTTRVPVQSRSEFGQLAQAFNRMAEDLTNNQQRLIERELEQRLLRREYDRKTADLEEARRFQLALLPKTLPEHADFGLAVAMRTATEVGGDYYDFHLDTDGDAGVLTVAIGDATGHGAKAGTMVTAIKGLLSADFAEESLSGFLTAAARAVRRMDLGRMAMALALARLSPGVLTVSSAGMPPVLLFRKRDGKVEEIALPGMPLGGMACEYRELCIEVEEGDTVLLTTDGLPELANADGDPLGYPRVRALLAGCGQRRPEEIVAELTAAAEAWTGAQPPKDDMTIVALQVRRSARAGDQKAAVSATLASVPAGLV